MSEERHGQSGKHRVPGVVVIIGAVLVAVAVERLLDWPLWGKVALAAAIMAVAFLPVDYWLNRRR